MVMVTMVCHYIGDKVRERAEKIPGREISWVLEGEGWRIK
jgi:hypothetical protein